MEDDFLFVAVVAALVDRFYEFFEEGYLGGVDDGAGFGKRKPASFVYFGEGNLFAGATGPFQLKRIAYDGGGIEVAGGGPGKDSFAAFLANGTQGLKGPFERGAGFFPKFADGGVQSRLVIRELSFGDGPDAGVLVFPEGAPGMYKKNF